MRKFVTTFLAAFMLSSCSQMATANGREYNTTVTTVLGFEGITDEKLPELADELKRFYRLERLGLGNNTLTDIPPLEEIKSLQYLCIFDTLASDEDIEQLRLQLPDCKINLDFMEELYRENSEGSA